MLQRFAVALKTFKVFNKKEMYDSVITGKENASKDWYCIISMFLISFNVCFVFVCACFMCICLKTTIWHFLPFCGRRPVFGEDKLTTLSK